MTGVVIAAVGELTDGVAAMLRAELPHERVLTLAETDGTTDGEVLVTMRSTEEELQRALATGVSWVHVLGAGVDGVALEILRGVTVTCSRGASAPSIAEFVMAAILAFEKQMPEVFVTEPPEQWGSTALGGVAGKTLGLIGIGSIGCEVARRALAFDMRVVALRRHDRPPPVDGIEVAPNLEDVLGQADHVVVAAPATEATRHIIDAGALAAMKRGVHLVNIARGTLVDQDALLAALDDGRVARATLDTVDPEPLPAGHPLYSHPRVRLSPHVAWSSPDSIRRTFSLFVDNVARFRAGEELTGLVDLDEGY